MAHPSPRALARIAVVSLATLYAVGSVIAASTASASTDFPLQQPCGPDPLTLIDPCESVPPTAPTTDQAQQIPWDVIDSVLFG
ncbi:MAG: hypothetical protein AB7G47_00175 [Mycolicibacterium sp.]|uniref:hypothetical protein n=1 Tax=Mycolicibacterium sp. TaxID=2320850 RepID=UPI003D12342C